jgi:hypothetical protein
MIHPLISDMSTFSNNELEAKIQDLTSKYWKCSNAGLQSQISLILEMFTTELRTRQLALWDKSAKQHDANLDGLININ